MAMIGVLLLCILTDASAVSVIPLANPIRATPGGTAVLPVSLQFQNSAWEFYHVKWEFITGNCPVLVYMVADCKGGPGSQERACQHSVEQAESYKQRANISFENPSLVLKAVQPEDEGTYQITVRSLDVSGSALVNLTVEGKFAQKSFSTINTIRLVFACLVFCILALTLGEYIHSSDSSFTQCKEPPEPPKMPDGGATLAGTTQHITVVPSTPAAFHGE